MAPNPSRNKTIYSAASPPSNTSNSSVCQPQHFVIPSEAGRGTVLVDVSIDRHGHVRTATIKQSAGKILAAAAPDAATDWEFTPMLIHGHPVPGWSRLAFKF